MKLIDKYLAKTVLGAIGLVTLMLLGMQTFMMFIDQMDSVGRGDYDFWQAVIVILLQTPYQVYLFFPVATLIGCLLGLGILANHSELIVLRVSGLSIGQIIGKVLKATLGFIILMSILGETVIPKMVSFAENRRAVLTSGGKALRTARGMWVREKESFIHIGEVLPNKQLKDILEYAFNDDFELKIIRHAASATHEGERWRLHNVRETLILPNSIKSQEKTEMTWQSLLSPKFLAVTRFSADEMNVWQLWKYIRAMKHNHLETSHFELVFWSRVFQPISAVIMMFLAIPFIFGPLRQASMGSRFLAGTTVGFAFHMLNKFFGPISLVYQLPPIIAALAPSLLFAVLGLLLLRRTR